MSIKSMDVKELKLKLDQKEPLILVDCREQSEWDAGHISQAIFIPLSNFEELYPDYLKDKNAKIILQCRSGKRSLTAAQFLENEGFKDLTNLEGGILDWSENNYPIVT